MKTLVLSFIALFLTSCSFKSGVKPATSKPTVLVSIAPYKKMVEQIAGDKVSCITIVPSGVDPHHYEPTLQKMHSLLDANIWFAIGEDFEGKIYPVLHQKNENLQLINLLDIFSALKRLKLSIPGSAEPLYYAQTGHNHGHVHESDKDTHIWLSPSLAITQVQFITHYLKKLLPHESSFFEQNSDKLIKELQGIHATLSQKLSPYKDAAILTNHEAFGYFCRDFFLQQIPVIASDFKELGAQDLSKVFEKIKNSNVRAAILQPEHPQKALTMIAEQNHYTINVIDPYAENYLETLNLLAKAITQS